MDRTKTLTTVIARLLVTGLLLLLGVALVYSLIPDPSLAEVQDLESRFSIAWSLFVFALLFAKSPWGTSDRQGKEPVVRFAISILLALPFLLFTLWLALVISPSPSKMPHLWLVAGVAGFGSAMILRRLLFWGFWPIEPLRKLWRPLQTFKISKLSQKASAAISRERGESPRDRTWKRSGYRDAHLLLRYEEYCVIVQNNRLTLHVQSRRLDPSKATSGASSLPEQVELALETSGDIHLSSTNYSALSTALTAILDALAGEGSGDWLHGSEPPAHPVKALVIDASGATVEWHTDGKTLTLSSPGYSDLSFDLERPFRLMVSVTPEGDNPAMGLLVRQQEHDSEGAQAGAQWREARLQVPLVRRPRGEALPEERQDAPRLKRASDFVDLWRHLYWASMVQGQSPPALPELSFTGDPDDKLHAEPLTNIRTSYLNPVPMILRTAGLFVVGFAMLGGLHSTTIVFPVMNQEFGIVLLFLCGLALVALSKRLWLTPAKSIREEACMAAAELQSFYMSLTYSQPTQQKLEWRKEELISFLQSGRPFKVTLGEGEALEMALEVWSVGDQPTGAALCERVVIGRRHGAHDQRWSELITELQERGIPHARKRSGQREQLTFEARRGVGSGAGAWGALARILTPYFKASTASTLVSPSLSAAPSPSARRARWLYAPLLLALSTLPLALPSVGTSAFDATLPSGSTAERLQACPKGDDLVSDIEEWTCLAYVQDPQVNLDLDEFSFGYSIIPDHRFWPTLSSCEQDTELADELEEIANRFDRRWPLFARDPQWGGTLKWQIEYQLDEVRSTHIHCPESIKHARLEAALERIYQRASLHAPGW